jgi:hypothetical protein
MLLLLLLLLLHRHAPMLLLPTGTVAATALYNSCGSSFISDSYNITSVGAVTQAAVCIRTVCAAQCSILHHQHLC